MSKPNCYACVHRRDLRGTAYSSCNAIDASVTGDVRGVRDGWFNWPLQFDPVWLQTCSSFTDDVTKNKATPQMSDIIRALVATQQRKK